MGAEAIQEPAILFSAMIGLFFGFITFKRDCSPLKNAVKLARIIGMALYSCVVDLTLFLTVHVDEFPLMWQMWQLGLLYVR